MRKPSKLLVALVVTVVSAELAAWVVVARLRPDGVLNHSAPHTASGGVTVPGTLGPRARPEHLFGESVHPYLGFMAHATRDGSVGTVMEINQPELYQPGSPLLDDDLDQVIVALAGGSVSHQLATCGGQEVLRSRLAALPSFAGRTLQFVALGGGGVKQPQQLLALQWLLVQGAQLDILINLDGFNEVALHETENELHGVAPIYPRQWLMRVDRRDTADLIGERAYFMRRRRDLAAGLLDSHLRWSRLRQLVWVAADRRLRHGIRAVDIALAAHHRGENHDFIRQGPRRSGSTVESRRAELVDIWRRSSVQLERTCRANGIEYYHFLQPNQYVAGSKEFSPEEARVAITTKVGYGESVPAAYPLLRAAGVTLVEEGVRFHDLTEVFKDHPEPLYVDDCCHVNAAGNAILAHAIVDAIVSWGR